MPPSRPEPASGPLGCYRFHAMKPDSGVRPYPEIAALAAHVASLYELSTVLDVGLSWTKEIGVLKPALKVVGIGQWGSGSGRPSSGFPFRTLVNIDEDRGSGLISRIDPSGSLVVVTGPSGSLADADMGMAVMDAAIRRAPVTIVATTTPETVLARLASMGLQPSFAGRTRATEEDGERSATVLIVDQFMKDPGKAPSDFRAVAIMTAYNEEDIIGPSIGKLIADGLGVYVIDNWSTDRTYEIVERFRGKGLVGLERFPDAPSAQYEWRSLLRRVEVVAPGIEADWCVHHDADERRSGPWDGVGLRDALWRVDRAGFSAVDHVVLNFRPTDNEFRPGGDFESHFRHFEFGRSPGLLLQIKAWKNTGPVDLAGSGGHEAVFRGRRVFPYRFELKHYPIRSQSHGELKVFRDRVARWDPRERALGWHEHYNDVQPQQSFLRDIGELIEDRGAETRTRFLPEMLTGAGLADRSVPAWALGGWTGRTVYLSMSRLVRSRAYDRLRTFPLFQVEVIKKLRRRLRRRLAA